MQIQSWKIFFLQDKENEDRPGLWLVKGSKEGAVQLSFYDDICYSMGEENKIFVL